MMIANLDRPLIVTHIVKIQRDRTDQWAELILQSFRHFTYVTPHSQNLPSLYIRHSSFPNPSFASPTSQTLHLRHLASRACCLNSRWVYLGQSFQREHLKIDGKGIKLDRGFHPVWIFMSVPVAQAVNLPLPIAGVRSSRLDHSTRVSWWRKWGLVSFSRGFSCFPSTNNFIPPFLHSHLIHFHFIYFHQPLWWCDRRDQPA